MTHTNANCNYAQCIASTRTTCMQLLIRPVDKLSNDSYLPYFIMLNVLTITFGNVHCKFESMRETYRS